MKAFLLAAGEGKRLKPITKQIPKCLVPIQGKPLLEIWLKLLEQIGITEILINTHHFSEQVENFLKNINTTVKYKISHEPKLLGSGGTLLKNCDFVSNESFFWIIYADNLTTFNLNELLELHHNKKPLLTIGLFHSVNPKQCGIVTMNSNNKIIEFIEKPMNPKSDLSNAGIMVASPEIINFIPDKIPCDLSHDVLPKFVGNMYGKVIDDFFIDIGTPENYRKAQEQWFKLNKMDVNKGSVQCL